MSNSTETHTDTNWGLFRVKIKRDGKWMTIDKTFDKFEAVDIYNHSPVPRMLTCDKGIVHRQYTNNNFIFISK